MIVQRAKISTMNRKNLWRKVFALLLITTVLIGYTRGNKTHNATRTDLTQCKLTHFGTEYQGQKGTTGGGIRCQSWHSSEPMHKVSPDIKDDDFPERSMKLAKNYCRNPTRDPKGPWCYSMEPTLIDDECGIPLCNYGECRISGLGSEYGGSKKVSVAGRKCKSWDNRHKLAVGHTEKFSNKNFPELSRSKAATFCRNPSGDVGGPWCYVEEEDFETVRKEYCDIPFCDDKDCLVYVRNASDYSILTKLNETYGNITLWMKLWNPMEEQKAEARLLLSLLPIPTSAKKIAQAWRAGVEIVISNSGSGQAYPAAGDEQELENTPNILQGSKWTGLWITWGGGFISAGLYGSVKPLFQDEYKKKNSIASLYPDSFLYYGLMGTGVLWSTEFCQEACEVHTTFGMEFLYVWPLQPSNTTYDIRFHVRASKDIAIRLYQSPGSLFPCFTMTIGVADTVTIIYQESEKSAKQHLKDAPGTSLLDFWAWKDFTLSIFGPHLRLFSERIYGNEEIIYLRDNLVGTIRWFSVGSFDNIAMWTFFCSPESNPVEIPSPPNCISNLGDFQYAGSQWTSINERPCTPWISADIPDDDRKDNLFIDGSAVKALNECRNPGHDPKGPYCYSISSENRLISSKQYCPIRSCRSSECRMAGTGNDYVGTLSITRSGRTCAEWMSSFDMARQKGGKKDTTKTFKMATVSSSQTMGHENNTSASTPEVLATTSDWIVSPKANDKETWTESSMTSSPSTSSTPSSTSSSTTKAETTDSDWIKKSQEWEKKVVSPKDKEKETSTKSSPSTSSTPSSTTSSTRKAKTTESDWIKKMQEWEKKVVTPKAKEKETSTKSSPSTSSIPSSTTSSTTKAKTTEPDWIKKMQEWGKKVVSPKAKEKEPSPKSSPSTSSTPSSTTSSTTKAKTTEADWVKKMQEWEKKVVSPKAKEKETSTKTSPSTSSTPSSTTSSTTKAKTTEAEWIKKMKEWEKKVVSPKAKDKETWIESSMKSSPSTSSTPSSTTKAKTTESDWIKKMQEWEKKVVSPKAKEKETSTKSSSSTSSTPSSTTSSTTKAKTTESDWIKKMQEWEKKVVSPKAKDEETWTETSMKSSPSTLSSTTKAKTTESDWIKKMQEWEKNVANPNAKEKETWTKSSPSTSSTSSSTTKGKTTKSWLDAMEEWEKKLKTKRSIVRNSSNTIATTRGHRWKPSLKPVHAVNPEYFNDTLYPEGSVRNASNYCRDPSRNIAGTWCYTTDPLVPQDLCDVRDCDMPEECTFLVKGHGVGRRLYVLPEHRSEGLGFSLKAWEPDQPDSITFVFMADDGLKSRYILKVGAANNEKVILYYQREEGEIEMVMKKTLPHLLYLGKWSSFVIKIPRGHVMVYYQGAPNPLFQWDHPEPLKAFLPIYYYYTSELGHTIGVAFDCASRCHIENTKTERFSRILPLSIWSKDSVSKRNKIELMIRAEGTVLIPLLLFPGTPGYFGLTVGELNHWIYFLKNTYPNVNIYHKQKTPSAIFSPRFWTNITIAWFNSTINIYWNETQVFHYEHTHPLIFYYFSLAVDPGGWATWAANCVPADIDGDPEDGGWSEWGPWACSASCNGGVGTRKRVCNNPEPNVKGEPCLGPSVMSGRCNTIACGDITEDTVSLIKRRIRRNHTSLSVLEGHEITIPSDPDIIKAIRTESADSEIEWSHNGIFVYPDKHRLEIEDYNIGIYTITLHRVDDTHMIFKLVSLVVYPVNTIITIRETLPMTVSCHCIILGYLYTDLKVSWTIAQRLWKNYGTTLPVSVNVDIVPSLNGSHKGLWECVVEQEDLGFRWVTNAILVNVIGPPNWRTHLMEDEFTKPIFGWMPNETFVATSALIIFLFLVACIAVGTGLYTRFREMGKYRDPEKPEKKMSASGSTKRASKKVDMAKMPLMRQKKREDKPEADIQKSQASRTNDVKIDKGLKLRAETSTYRREKDTKPERKRLIADTETEESA